MSTCDKSLWLLNRKKVSFLSFWSEIQCLSRSCADKAEAAANVDGNNANRQKFPDIPVESITSYSGKRFRASTNKYAKSFTGVKSSMCTHAHSLSGWPSGELQEVSPVRVSRCSPLMAPPFSWKWRTESTHPKLPAGQHPSNSNLLPLINTAEETWRRGFAVYLCWNLFLTSFILLLSEAGDGRRDRPRNVDMRSSTPIIVPPGSCWPNVPCLPAGHHNSSNPADEQSRIVKVYKWQQVRSVQSKAHVNAAIIISQGTNSYICVFPKALSSPSHRKRESLLPLFMICS